ncbi:hypothetical protein VNO77_21674 [Canavalia gladiata]|uniref:Uncharacterized protein n=1 Tax=Canavalia gladiata TaxID=3824 RepID=A0AAN9QKI2_CANGL
MNETETARCEVSTIAKKAYSTPFFDVGFFEEDIVHLIFFTRREGIAVETLDDSASLELSQNHFILISHNLVI